MAIKIPCGKILGHGEYCCKGDLCEQCAEIERLISENAKLRGTLTEATETLERCRYSEQPMAKKCRAILNEQLKMGNEK